MKNHTQPTLTQEGHDFLEEVDALADEVWEEAPGVVHTLEATPDEKAIKTTKRMANVLFILSMATCLLLTCVLLLSNFSVGFFGLRFFMEPTDAMSPAIRRGSLLITQNRRPSQIQPGDIITYHPIPSDPNSRLTRIVDQRLGDNGEYRFRTRRPGTNVMPDSIEVNAANILGVRVASIPYAGYVISTVQTHAWLFAVLAAALCIASVLLRKWLKPSHGFRRKEHVDDGQTLF